MDINQILELGKMGFNKEEILMLMNADSTVNKTPEIKEETAPVSPVAPTEQSPVVANTPEQAPAAVTTPQTLNLSDDTIARLIQGLNVKTVSGTIEMPKSYNDTIADRLSAKLQGLE